jgi:phage/plasmid-like protein (TIGR03299 family)
MPHNLARKADGSVAFAYNQEGGRPWHGLGTPIQGAMTTEEAFIKGGVDFEVEKQSFKTVAGIDCPKWMVTVRKDTKVPLGVVGKDYEVVQNRDVFKFFDIALKEAPEGEDAPAIIDTVGALGKGERVFMMAALPGEVEVTHDDLVERYLLLTTSHDGSYSIKILFTPIRVVCQNTLHAAMSGAKSVVSIRHTKNVEASLEQAHRMLAESHKYWFRAMSAFRYMGTIEMDGAKVKDFLDKVFPARAKKGEMTTDPETGEEVPVMAVGPKMQKIRDEIVRLYDGGAEGFNLAGHTAWGMWNAVTQWIDHSRKSRTGINQWENSVFGLGASIRQKSFDALIGSLPNQKDLVPLLQSQGLM